MVLSLLHIFYHTQHPTGFLLFFSSFHVFYLFTIVDSLVSIVLQHHCPQATMRSGTFGKFVTYVTAVDETVKDKLLQQPELDCASAVQWDGKSAKPPLEVVGEVDKPCGLVHAAKQRDFCCGHIDHSDPGNGLLSNPPESGVSGFWEWILGKVFPPAEENDPTHGQAFSGGFAGENSPPGLSPPGGDSKPAPEKRRGNFPAAHEAEKTGGFFACKAGEDPASPYICQWGRVFSFPG